MDSQTFIERVEGAVRDGLSVREIAAKLCITERSVKKLKKRLYDLRVLTPKTPARTALVNHDNHAR